MMKCDVLEGALNGNYNGLYADFEKEICYFVEEYMDRYMVNPRCYVRKKVSFYGCAIDSDRVFLN